MIVVVIPTTAAAPVTIKKPSFMYTYMVGATEVFSTKNPNAGAGNRDELSARPSGPLLADRRAD
jgi:hypothetical protein